MIFFKDCFKIVTKQDCQSFQTLGLRSFTRNRSRKFLIHGFTIMEVMVVIFVGTMVVLGLLSLYLWHSKIYNLQQATVRVTESGRMVMQTMETDVIQAYRVLESFTIDGVLYTSDSDTLILQLPAIDQNGNILQSTWDYVVYNASGSNLNRLVSIDASSSRKRAIKLLSDSVQNITFTYSDSVFANVNKITVNLTCQLPLREQTVNFSLEKNINLRNYY